MPSLKEQIVALTTAKHRLAVWEMLYSHLDGNYVPKDTGAAQKAIRVADCSPEIVPPEIVEEVLKELSEGPIKDLQGEITVMENQEITLKRKAGA
jgi:hypothetical protein